MTLHPATHRSRWSVLHSSPPSLSVQGEIRLNPIQIYRKLWRKQTGESILDMEIFLLLLLFLSLGAFLLPQPPLTRCLLFTRILNFKGKQQPQILDADKETKEGPLISSPATKRALDDPATTCHPPLQVPLIGYKTRNKRLRERRTGRRGRLESFFSKQLAT